MSRMTQDLTTAMKARQSDVVSTLRQIVALVRTEEKSGKVAKMLTEAEVLKLLAKEVKKREESALIFEQAKRPELAARERSEITIIKTYLPESLGEEELDAMIEEALAETGAQSMKDMGAVMKVLNARVAGRADGALVSSKVKARLA